MVGKPKDRAKPAAAQAGTSDVVAHPAFRQVPKSLFPLIAPEAQVEYDTISRMLFERGMLTAGKHRALSSYAMQFDTITRAAAEGKQVRGSWFTQLDKARRELGLDEIDKPIAAPQGAGSKFARTGFASRRR